jgi:hypothetical protein
MSFQRVSRAFRGIKGHEAAHLFHGALDTRFHFPCRKGGLVDDHAASRTFRIGVNTLGMANGRAFWGSAADSLVDR